MEISLLSVAIKNLKRKSFRTAVLVASIGLFVSILVFGSSFIISVGASIRKASDRLGADLLVVPVGARDYAEEVLLETKVKVFYMDSSILERVMKVEGVDEVTYHTYLETVWGVCCDVPAAKVVVFDQDTDFIVRPWLKKSLGRRLNKGEAIVGHEAYENLGLLDIDSSVLFNIKFNIVGVLEKTDTGLDNAIFFTKDNLADIVEKGSYNIKPGQISLIFAKIMKGYDAKTIGMNLESEIVEVDVIERNDIGKRIISTLRDINRVFLITIIMASLLSAFLAWSVFSAIANERVKEVGIMRALGAKGSHVAGLFFLEVLMLGLIGSLVGALVGTYMSMTLSGMFTLLKDVAAELTISEHILIGLMGIVVGTGVCIVGAFSSLMRIRNLDPHVVLKEV